MNSIQRPREFGELLCGADYLLRPGAYAVIRRATGEIAVVTTPQGCFLPGGGQNRGESLAQAAIREAQEECALRIQIGSLIGVADQLVYSADEATHFRKRCSFYQAKALAFDGDEADHVLSWVAPDVAVQRLTHESQQWAVAKGCGISEI